MKCVVTGGASGIGAALLHSFATNGYDPVGVDINLHDAEATSQSLARFADNVSFIVADLATDAGIQKTVDLLDFDIDVLIHNAGINAVGRFEHVPVEKQQEVINLNLLTPMLLTKALVERDRFKPHSTIVFMSSLSHFVSYPGAAAYAASKDGLVAYARNLSVALADKPVHVLTVYPGPTRTAHARRYSPDNRKERRRMRPEKLASAIFAAVQTREHHLVPGFNNRLAAFLSQRSPRLAERIMRKALLEPLGDRQLY
ncbi:MAG: SDR family oxidoreductase [Deinococcota bacterium]